MTTGQLLASTWHWHPSILLGCLGLLLAYGAALRFQWQNQALVFIGGVTILVIALLSPLHELGDTYLFSAHMLQHLLLLLIVPPLLLLGLPASLVRGALRNPVLSRLERVLGQPWMAWSIGNGAMWVWHLPVLYNAALAHQGIHIVEHLCFLGSALVFWWPVLAPGAATRLQPLAAILYLFGAMITSGVLGAILTFAEPGWYPAYLDPHDPLRVLPLIRGTWGLTPAADQQLGGLLMWVPGNLVYLIASMGMLARWYSLPEEPETRIVVEL